MQIDDQTALQARLDALFEILDLDRGAVGRNDDLLVLIDQRVEGVKEFLLRAVFAGDELHIIDHQHIDRAEELFEVHHLPVAQRLHEAVHELFRRKIDHPQFRLLFLQLPGDGVHQVRLAKPNAAVKEQRVEGDRAALGNAARSGMGQFVWLADNEAVKGEARDPAPRRAGRLQ